MATHANSIPAPKIDPAAVMRDAWFRYRRLVRSGPFERSIFHQLLALAWEAARIALPLPPYVPPRARGFRIKVSLEGPAHYVGFGVKLQSVPL